MIKTLEMYDQIVDRLDQFLDCYYEISVMVFEQQ